MTINGAPSQRLCPSCRVCQPILPSEPVWPAGVACQSCGFQLPSSGGFALLAPALADTVTGIDPAGFAPLRQAEESHFWFRTRTRLLTGLINRYFPEARAYFEIGCGNGVVLSAVNRLHDWDRLVGSELHPTGLMYARERLGPGVELVQMDARDIPARNAFDLVGAFDVLEHIEEDNKVISAVYDVLRPGGGFIASAPQHPSLWSASDDLAHHVRRYERGELENKLRRAGFEVLRSTSFASLLLPAMMLSRSGRNKSAKTSEEMMQAEFHLPGWLNMAMGLITDLEVSATLAGVSWPVGGSRIVVARKGLPKG